jgi:xanthine dehydrogenase accessory factor
MPGPSLRELHERLGALVASGEPFALATVVEVEGSASARPGAKLLVDARGTRVFGWVGGGCAETTVRDEALRAIADGRARVIRLDLDDEVLGVGMPCGGHMRVYIEPMLPEPTLLLLGHGVLAETVAELAKLLEFRVVVNDPLATPDAFPRADVRITDDPDYAKLECDERTYVVISTQHKSDYEALARALRQRPAYVGLVASRKRSALLFERLHEDGFSADELRRVSAPSGLDLGAETPQEIALSIVAEIAQRRRGEGTSGRPLVLVKGVRIDESGVEVPEGPVESAKCPR